MPFHTLKAALVKNKYYIVRRTLRLTGQAINPTGASDFDEDASLKAIEDKLKANTEPASTGNIAHWLQRLFKR